MAVALKCSNCASLDASQLHTNAFFPLSPTFVPFSLKNRRHRCPPRPSPDISLPAADAGAASPPPRHHPPPPRPSPRAWASPNCLGGGGRGGGRGGGGGGGGGKGGGGRGGGGKGGRGRGGEGQSGEARGPVSLA